jgi:pyruvate/2-oxoglutarate dehydrogenase complex dihydrolipoamide acyltransferase (E2) component
MDKSGLTIEDRGVIEQIIMIKRASPDGPVPRSTTLAQPSTSSTSSSATSSRKRSKPSSPKATKRTRKQQASSSVEEPSGGGGCEGGSGGEPPVEQSSKPRALTAKEKMLVERVVGNMSLSMPELADMVSTMSVEMQVYAEPLVAKRRVEEDKKKEKEGWVSEYMRMDASALNQVMVTVVRIARSLDWEGVVASA